MLVHNFYREPGGEDNVFRAEATLLREHGHDVETFTVHNDDVLEGGRLRAAANTIWNAKAASSLRRRLDDFKPAIVHVHNTVPMLSPAVYHAAKRAGAAVVQTVHNYRFVCPAASLFRSGAVCEACVARSVPWPAVVHACYRDSRSASAAVVAMLAAHRALGTYRRDVDAYIALTAFSRNKLIEGGMDGSRIHVKPNFLTADPGVGDHDGRFALYVGRLVDGKGIETLLEAWSDGTMPLPLRIVGDGPMVETVREVARALPQVDYLGRLPHEAVVAAMKAATLLVFPSLWYENFPLTVLEAMAVGLPVVASDIGVLPELVSEATGGRRFPPADARGLADAVRRIAASPEEARTLRANGRRTYLRQFSSDENYRQLMDIYARARQA